MADVEKVARALCRHDNVGYMGGDFLEDIIDKEWPRYIPQARAALAAMGEWEAVGFFATLTPVQQAAALTYHGPENLMPSDAPISPRPEAVLSGYGDYTPVTVRAGTVASPRPEAVEEIAAIAESLRQAYPMEASRILILLGKAQPAAIRSTAEPPAPTTLKPSTPDQR